MVSTSARAVVTVRPESQTRLCGHREGADVGDRGRHTELPRFEAGSPGVPCTERPLATKESLRDGAPGATQEPRGAILMDKAGRSRARAPVVAASQEAVRGDRGDRDDRFWPQ